MVLGQAGLGCFVFQCRSPPGQAGDVVYVDLALNMVVLAKSSEHGFAYHPGLTVQGLVPTSGPALHGFTLTLLGNNFLLYSHGRVVVVRVGNKMIDARISSSSTVQCVITGQAPGNYSVEASIDGVDFSENGFRIHVEGRAVTRNVYDISPSHGPTAGGIRVVLKIESTTAAELVGIIRCCFGRQAVEGKLMTIMGLLILLMLSTC